MALESLTVALWKTEVTTSAGTLTCRGALLAATVLPSLVLSRVHESVTRSDRFEAHGHLRTERTRFSTPTGPPTPMGGGHVDRVTRPSPTRGARRRGGGR